MTKVSALAATALLAVLPLTASATEAAPTADELVVVAEILEPEAPGLDYHQPGQCSRGWVRIEAHSITARTAKNPSAPRAFQIVSPDGLEPMYYPCRSMEVGASYPPVCGAANTGWILVTAPQYERQGWIVNQCTSDPLM